jgi:hypothetical protein
MATCNSVSINMETHKRESVKRFTIDAGIWSVKGSNGSVDGLEEAEAWKQFFRMPEGQLLRGSTVLAKR